MTPQQAENLRILIRHMETKCRRELYMEIYAFGGNCGTPACALGEAMVVPNFEQLARAYESDFGDSFQDLKKDLFTSSIHDWVRLFGSASGNVWKRENVTPQEWATEARKVLAENGYAMDAAPTSDGFAAFMDRVRAPVAVEA